MDQMQWIWMWERGRREKGRAEERKGGEGRPKNKIKTLRICPVGLHLGCTSFGSRDANSRICSPCSTPCVTWHVVGSSLSYLTIASQVIAQVSSWREHHLVPQSFCGAGIWAWLSWLPLSQGDSQGCSHLKDNWGWSSFQFTHLAAGWCGVLFGSLLETWAPHHLGHS